MCRKASQSICPSITCAKTVLSSSAWKNIYFRHRQLVSHDIHFECEILSIIVENICVAQSDFACCFPHQICPHSDNPLTLPFENEMRNYRRHDPNSGEALNSNNKMKTKKKFSFDFSPFVFVSNRLQPVGYAVCRVCGCERLKRFIKSP